LQEDIKIAAIFTFMFKGALTRFVYTALLFLAGLVLSNLALPEKFGVLSILILNASLLAIITGFGIDSMVLYKLSNKLWTVSQAFRFLWLGIFLQVVIFGLLEAASWLIFHSTLLCHATPEYFVIESCYFIGLAIVEKYLSLFYAQNQSAVVNRVLATVAFSYLLLLVLFYYFAKVEWIYILYLFAFQNIAQALALIIRFKPYDKVKTTLQNREVFASLKTSSVVMVTNVIQLLAYRLDFWLLNYFYGNYEVGIYAQANKFANFSWIVPGIVSQILIPRFASMKNSETAEIFSMGFSANFLIIILTTVITWFFYFFYLDAEYRPGLTAFYMMLPGYFFWATVIYFANYFSAKGKFIFNLIGSVLCFVLVLVADIILIPRYGIQGAGMANTLAYTLVFMVYLFIFMKKESFGWNQLLLPRKKSFFNIFKMVSK
jgi:O-antigen/teichoic acid export membrane protein